METTVAKAQSQVYNEVLEILLDWGLSRDAAHIANAILLLLCLGLVLFLADHLFRKILLYFIIRAVRKSRTRLDDYLLRNRVVKYFMHIVTVVVAQQFLPLIFLGFPGLINGTLKLTDVLLIAAVGMFLNAVQRSLRDWLKSKKAFEDKPIDSYAQVLTILIFFVCGIMIFSLLTGQSPYAFLISLGAASAVLLLIFKDTILGFVASIQVSANDMVRVGDWVEMPKYGADGDVLSINLATVKIRNFDRTITTVPTYAFISDSFKNWRGMQESGGRRIKRSIHLKMSSFRFLDADDIEKFKKYRLIRDYITQRENEIAQHNKNIDAESISVNIRRMSNIGVFRVYAEAYLKENKRLHKNMTTMVRQLSPTPQGLPLEIYCFTNDIRWVNYEVIIADIFDHLMTIVPEFGLRIFEEPAGDDFRDRVPV
ncbi:mechanosensitive ion channel family protein [Flavobacterium selenitireducens]|uniref:mechanosensitive ion channel family protein n=1 Tax=Flavobacterium selenitireducens TaxID=2722704 RepID=UPI00168B1889|nr:mechanosensitive ion channel domain-containing protein [Flavobacterium selenitireducens]MBD3582806.1 mechanosensitive ion channel [Flavobacterium selenitireducens]